MNTKYVRALSLPASSSMPGRARNIVGERPARTEPFTIHETRALISSTAASFRRRYSSCVVGPRVDWRTMSRSVGAAWASVLFRAVSRSASKYMTVPAINDEASSTPMTTDESRRQFDRLRLITNCHTTASRAKARTAREAMFGVASVMGLSAF